MRGTAVAALCTLSLSAVLSGGALAKSGGSGDHGGNGEGTLQIFSTQNDAVQGMGGGNPITSLVAGQTYYIDLANPGGQTSETNLHNVPQTLTFNFYSPVANFQGDPNKAQQDSGNIKYSVSGSEVSKHPFVYAVKIPSTMLAGDYTIATFGLSAQPQSNGKDGEDEFFFSTDPTVNGGGTGGIAVNSPMTNNMPETPWAGALPLAIAGLGGAAWMYVRRRRPTAR